MIFINLAEKEGLSLETYAQFICLLAPFAPHLSEELWSQAGKKNSIHIETFPVADQELAKDNLVTIGVQINGKVRGDITIAPDATEAEAVVAAEADESLQSKLTGAEYKKIIYVPGRILNIIL